jgi:ribosomal protein L12E/L44/L45/RPP1/RPP2
VARLESDQNTWETADRVAEDLLAGWKKTNPAAAAGGAAGAAAGAAPAGAAADAAADADDEDDADDEESRTSPS